jgi:hypothetical protein
MRTDSFCRIAHPLEEEAARIMADLSFTLMDETADAACLHRLEQVNKELEQYEAEIRS